MAAVSWPALVSVAGGVRVKETTKVVHEVVDRLTPSIPLSGWDRSLCGQGPNRQGLCSVQKTPSLRLSFGFPSSTLGPSVPWPCSPHQSLVETREDFLEGCVAKTWSLI